MKIPDFIRDVIWALYPPRYRQLADKTFKHSLGYMGKVLLIAFIISGILLIPKLATLQSSIENDFTKFETFKLYPDITQTERITIPQHNPWVVVDLNSNYTLTNELFVVDNEDVQYRFFGVKSIPRSHLLEPKEYSVRASRFFALMILLMLPGIALLLYIRMWLKYFFLIVTMGTLFFLIMELTKFKLKWKQMLNVAAHSLTVIIFLELIIAAISGKILLPFLRFLGVNLYAVTTVLFAAAMVAGIVGYHATKPKKK